MCEIGIDIGREFGITNAGGEIAPDMVDIHGCVLRVEPLSVGSDSQALDAPAFQNVSNSRLLTLLFNIRPERRASPNHPGLFVVGIS